jgi:pimeloyl-ACP methyl ester carboxylesterase
MATEKNIQFQGQSIYYRIEGSGQPVMLVHGFSEDGTVWENQVAALNNQYQLIIPDLPGSGQSSNINPESTKSWSMEYFAECLLAILQEENIEKLTMIGHSMGGYITLAFAEKYPEKLQAFSLFHSSAFADSEEKIATRRKGIKFIRENGPQKFLEQSIPNLFSEETKKQRPELVQKILSRFTNFSAESLVSYYEAMILRPDRTSVLKNFSHPVQFIMGKFDSAVPLEQGLQQCHLPGLSYIHILDHSGHMGMWEESDLSNGFLQSFMSNVNIE